MCAFALLLPASCFSQDGEIVSTEHRRSATQPPMAPRSAPVPSGKYDLVFEADSACDELPTAAKSRRYSATAGSVGLTLEGAMFGEPYEGEYSWNVIYASVDGDLATLNFNDPEIWELPTPDSYVVILGSAAGRFDAQTSTLPMTGQFRFCPTRETETYPECAVDEVKCQSTHHKLTLTRK